MDTSGRQQATQKMEAMVRVAGRCSPHLRCAAAHASLLHTSGRSYLSWLGDGLCPHTGVPDCSSHCIVYFMVMLERSSKGRFYHSYCTLVFIFLDWCVLHHTGRVLSFHLMSVLPFAVLFSHLWCVTWCVVTRWSVVCCSHRDT